MYDGTINASDLAGLSREQVKATILKVAIEIAIHDRDVYLNEEEYSREEVVEAAWRNFLHEGKQYTVVFNNRRFLLLLRKNGGFSEATHQDNEKHDFVKYDGGVLSSLVGCILRLMKKGEFTEIDLKNYV